MDRHQQMQAGNIIILCIKLAGLYYLHIHHILINNNLLVVCVCFIASHAFVSNLFNNFPTPQGEDKNLVCLFVTCLYH